MVSDCKIILFFSKTLELLASVVILLLLIIRKHSSILEKNWLILTPLTNSLQSQFHRRIYRGIAKNQGNWGGVKTEFKKNRLKILQKGRTALQL